MLDALVDIRPEERRTTLAACFMLFAITTGHTLLETARDTFFLTTMPVSQLPIMYLAIVGVALVLAQLPAASASSKRAVAASLLVAALITSAFWALLGTASAPASLIYAFYVWTGVFGSWAMVRSWTLLGRIHSITQAKRLYGFIGAGAVLGAVVGALVARVAMTLVSPRSAVLVAAAIFVIAVIPCSLLEVPRDDGGEATLRGAAARRKPTTASFELLWGNAFARRVLGIVLLSTMTVTLADFLFKSQIASKVTDARALGVYLSTFYAITNGLALVAQIFVAPLLIRRAGVQQALFVFPSSLLVAALAVVVSGGGLAAAVVLKGLDGVLRYSLHKTSTELLLVPLPDRIRERVKPLVDLLGSRGGQALASIGILALVALSFAEPVTLGAIIVVLAALWLALAVTLRTSYLQIFRDALATGSLSGGTELPALDLSALEILFAALNSDRDDEVLPALELLAEQRRDRLVPALILHHPSRKVVLRALEIFTEQGRTDIVRIADRLNSNADREIAAAALRARIAVQPDRALLVTRLDDACPNVSVTALIGLMAHGWVTSDDVESRLARVLDDPAWSTMIEIARGVRILGAPATDAPPDAAMMERLDRLLIAVDELATSRRVVGRTRDDGGPPDVRVRLEVARAIESRRSPRFVPLLVRMLERYELRATARQALRAIPSALEALDAALSDESFSRDARVHIPPAIALFEAKAAASVLLRHLGADGSHATAVRFRIIRALVKLRRRSPELTLDLAAVNRNIATTLDRAEELRAWSTPLAAKSKDVEPMRVAHHLLVDLLRGKELHAGERVLLLLELAHGSVLEDVWRGLRSKDPKAHASSVELIENLVKPPLRARVLALAGTKASGSLSYEEALQAIVAQPIGTMRTLAEARLEELAAEKARGSASA